MRPPVTIDDPADPRLVDYVDLADPDLRRRVEARDGFFIAESPLVVGRLLRSGRRVRSVLVTPGRYDALHDDLAADLDPAVPVFVAPDAVLRRVVGFDLHRGAVASADRWPMPSLGAVLDGARRIAVLERVNDHENLGVLFRERGRARDRCGAARRARAPTRCTGAACGSRSGTCCRCRGLASIRSTTCGTAGLHDLRADPDPRRRSDRRDRLARSGRAAVRRRGTGALRCLVGRRRTSGCRSRCAPAPIR